MELNCSGLLSTLPFKNSMCSPLQEGALAICGVRIFAIRHQSARKEKMIVDTAWMECYLGFDQRRYGLPAAEIE
jgi:hypothetical protein